MDERLSSLASNSKFAESVSDFSSADLEATASDSKPAIGALLIRSVLIALCICIFGYSVFMLASSYVETKRNSELYDSIRPSAVISAVVESASLPEPASMYTLQQMLDSNGVYSDYYGDVDSPDAISRRSNYFKNFLSFQSKYPNAYAWIYTDYTKIDYPIMKTDNNDYYLYHDFNGNDSSAGSVFADCRIADDHNANLNTIIYGHCMKNGSMFRSLKSFMESANRNTLSKTMNIEIYTSEGLYIYKVLSGYRDDSFYFAKTSFASTDEYKAFLDKIVSENTLRVTNNYDTDSRICTLITCANVSSNEDERYVLHGVLSSFIPASQLG